MSDLSALLQSLVGAQPQADLSGMGAMPQSAPTMPKQGFFQPGGMGRLLAGAIGDALAQNAHMQPVFMPTMMKQREAQQEDARWTNRQNSQLQNQMALKQWEYANKPPEEAPVTRETNAYMAMSPPQRAAYDAMHPVYRIGPDGLPYPMARGAAPPTAPVGGLTPIDGGANAPGAPPFAGNSLAGITAQSESGNRDYLPNGQPVTSPKGAKFAMQVMPSTAHDPGYGVRPVQNESAAEYDRVGREYQAAMQRHFGGDPAKAWAAYNGGPGRLSNALQQPNWLQAMPGETQNYVAHNMRALRGR